MHISKIKEKFENMTVRNKILFILCLIMVMFFAVSLIGMRITFDIYGDVLYEQAYKSLNLTTRNIEHDIENIDNVSYAIVADSNIQQYLETIKDSKDALEITNDTTTVMNQMNNYASNQPFISNINFIDTRGIQSTTGLLDSYISSDAITPIAEKAAAAGGSSVFIDHVAGDDSVYLTRVIREVSKLRFDNMGTLVIRCNLNQIAAKYLDVTKGNSSTLVIFNGKNRIYRSSGVSVSDSEIIGIKSNSNYVLKDIGGVRYFMVIDTSAYTGWKYVYLIPYNTIFGKIIAVKWAEITILLAVFTLIILMGVRFALDLTRPLERLTKEIKLVESGNFNLPRDYRQGPERRDEIGAIQHDFEIMTGKIDELIRENYIKQLVIKDTQMKALQAQINPHFLYNTLESINWMAKVNGQADISLMAESLGNLLRGALKAKENTVSVGEELTLLQNYINIQKIRYEERLDFRMLVDDELKKYRIPPLTLQPIVENAIVYSLEKMNDVCLITVQFVTCDGNIKVFIKDNGPGIEPELLGRINSGEFKPRGFGIGLKNINERLKLVFGDEYGISVHSIQGTGTMVELLIPMRE